MPEPEVPLAWISPPWIVSVPTGDERPFSPSPLPIPVPPVPDTDPFTIVIDEQEPDWFALAPIPAALLPPVTESEPNSTAWIVTFDSSAQPIPAASSREISTFAPSAINVTPLLEIVTAALVFIDTPESRMTTCAFEILRELLIELPVTSRSVTPDSFTPLQVSASPAISTGSALILQVVIGEMKS
jgi:hypothetical protein